MSIVRHEPMTLAEFLDWEERQEFRYEFDGFHPVAMTDGTATHELIVYRLRTLLPLRLEGNHAAPGGQRRKSRSKAASGTRTPL